jgi:putative oxidoreductase
MAHPHVLRDIQVHTERSFDRVSPRSWFASLAGVAHLVLRAGAGVLFMEHGLQKLFGALGGFGGTPGATAPLASLMGFAGIIETVGGALLVLGLLTRFVGTILMCEMLYAYATAHLPHGGWPIQNGGELALLYACVFFFLATHGAGPASVDRSIRRGTL